MKKANPQRVSGDENYPLVSLLRLSGIVRVAGQEGLSARSKCGSCLAVRNRIYAHVFDRHWRGAASARRTGAGGLGLAIAKRIVALHGGTLDIESELGRGTSFSFSIAAAVPLSGSHERSW